MSLLLCGLSTRTHCADGFFCKISIFFCIVACHFARCDEDFCLDGMTAQTLFIKKHEDMTIIITENVFCIRNNCFFVVS